MIHALLAVAVLAALAAAVRARAVVGAALAIGAFAAGTFFDVAPTLRFACWLYGVAALGKTLALARLPRGTIPAGRSLAFLVGWPGLDPERSFVRDPEADCGRPAGRAGVRRVLVGLAEVAAAFGAAAVALRAGLYDAPEPVPSWARAASFVLLMDGGFRAGMGAFRAAGLASEEVFRDPWRMSDLADFWGRRWNRFVGRTLTLEVFRPVKRRVGRVVAVLATFFMSGVLHEAVVGVPAGAPDGRYVAFFLAHGVALIVLAWTFPRAPRTAGGRLARRGAAWAVLLATAPLFFGGPYPSVLPIERILP